MLQVGDSYQEEITFTQEMEQKFIDITGDDNPIHTQADAALKYGGYNKPIVHGMLCVIMFNKLGVKFIGDGTIVLEKYTKFIRPVFVGEVYSMLAKIDEIDTQNNYILVHYRLKDSKERICIDCTTKVRHNALSTSVI